MSKLTQIRSRPATVIMTTRADMRYIAILANFWHSQNETPGSISELIRLSLESFAEFLVITKKTEFVQTHSDAMEIIERLGLKVKKTNPKALAQILADESSSFDSILQTPQVDRSHQERIKSNPVSEDSPDLSIARGKLEEALSDDLNKRVKTAQDNTAEFKKSMLLKEREKDEST